LEAVTEASSFPFFLFDLDREEPTPQQPRLPLLESVPPRLLAFTRPLPRLEPTEELLLLESSLLLLPEDPARTLRRRPTLQEETTVPRQGSTRKLQELPTLRRLSVLLRQQQVEVTVLVLRLRFRASPEFTFRAFEKQERRTREVEERNELSS